MGWQLYPALAEEPKYIVVGTPRPYFSLLSTEEAHLSLAVFCYLASF